MTSFYPIASWSSGSIKFCKRVWISFRLQISCLNKMRAFLSIPTLLLAAFIREASSSAHTHTKRDSCVGFASIPAGPYTLYQNLWGQGSATSGWQCTGLDYQGGDVVTWHTTWDWQGGRTDVKSYSNIDYTFNARQLSSISRIPTTWKWR